MTPPDTVIDATLDGRVLVVRLANPAGRNSIGMPFADQLLAALQQHLDSAGAVVVVADGAQFCVGGDVRAMAAAEDTPAFLTALAGRLHESMELLAAGPPVVVAARGWSAGAGMSIVAAADVAVAGESSMFQPAYAGLGVTPDGGMTHSLPRLVGERRARSMILRNVALTAADALGLGLVDEVVPDAGVDGRALEIARSLAAGPREAHLGIKALLMASAGRSLAEQLAAEARSIGERAGSPDGREGIAAFVERRAPVFGGASAADAAR